MLPVSGGRGSGCGYIADLDDLLVGRTASCSMTGLLPAGLPGSSKPSGTPPVQSSPGGGPLSSWITGAVTQRRADRRTQSPAARWNYPLVTSSSDIDMSRMAVDTSTSRDLESTGTWRHLPRRRTTYPEFDTPPKESPTASPRHLSAVSGSIQTGSLLWTPSGDADRPVKERVEEDPTGGAAAALVPIWTN